MAQGFTLPTTAGIGQNTRSIRHDHRTLQRHEFVFVSQHTELLTPLAFSLSRPSFWLLIAGRRS